jgi:hypothetical protein
MTTVRTSGVLTTSENMVTSASLSSRPLARQQLVREKAGGMRHAHATPRILPDEQCPPSVRAYYA